MKRINENFIDLTLEISRGCSHACSGCTVDRYANQFPTDAEFDRIINMLKDAESNNFIAANLSIGPTDILASENREECLTHPKIKELTTVCNKLALQCAFLNPKPEEYEWLADRVNDLIPGGLLKIAVPFEVKHVNNIKYIETVKNRIKYFESLLKDITITRIYSVINFEETINSSKTGDEYLTSDVLKAIHSIDLHPTHHLDYALPFGRKDISDPVIKESFLKTIKIFNLIMPRTQALVDEDGINIYDLNDFQIDEGTDWNIVYHNGNLYRSAFLNEPFVSFDPRFKLSDDWSFASIQQQEHESEVAQYIYAQQTEDCVSCQFLSTCVTRNLLSVMEVMDTKQCLSMLPARPNNFHW